MILTASRSLNVSIHLLYLSNCSSISSHLPSSRNNPSATPAQVTNAISAYVALFPIRNPVVRTAPSKTPITRIHTIWEDSGANFLVSVLGSMTWTVLAALTNKLRVAEVLHWYEGGCLNGVLRTPLVYCSLVYIYLSFPHVFMRYFNQFFQSVFHSG